MRPNVDDSPLGGDRERKGGDGEGGDEEREREEEEEEEDVDCGEEPQPSPHVWFDSKKSKVSNTIIHLIRE